MNYVGKLVFLERNGESIYDNGEYLILKQSPFTLYGIKPLAGYGCHQLKQFNIRPNAKDGYTIVDSADADDLHALADDIQYFADSPKRGEKLQWVENLYAEAGHIAQMIRRLIAPKPTTSTIRVTDLQSIRIDFRNGEAFITAEFTE